MNFVKHKKSGRVYELRDDHGPNCPFLYYPPKSISRYPKPQTLDRFFTASPGPVADGTITVREEIEWEKREKSQDNPGVEEKPKASSHKGPLPQNEKSSGIYTLKEICGKLNTSPTVARRALRAKGLKAPEGGWSWCSEREAQKISRIIRDFLQ